MAEDSNINIDQSSEDGGQQFGVVYGDVHIHQVVTSHTEEMEALAPIRNPYKALNAFTSEDAEDFFGRERLTQELASMITPSQAEQRGDRFLAVVGASGSGKSSVVRAGLIPHLLSGGVPGVPWWTVVRATPGERPLEGLATQLGAAENLSNLAPSDILREIETDERGLYRLAERELARREHNARLLLLIDQFEELYTLVPDEREEERDKFIRALLVAASVPRGRTVVLITIRADFYGQLTDAEMLKEWLPRRQVNVGRMSLRELRQAIVGPAENVGLAFENGLVEHILDDVEDEPGALPLMQFALTELYSHRDGNMLTAAAYDAINGVKGALAKTADEAFDKLSERQQEALRAALLRLVQLGEGQEDTRRRVLMDELRPARGDVTPLERALSSFVNRRLLIAGRDRQSGQPIYEVSHEALISNWQRFQSWLDADRDNQRLLRQLDDDAARWNAEGRPPDDFLAPRVMVERIETQLERKDLNRLERDYLDASINRVMRARQVRRRLQIVSGIVAVVMTILAIMAVLLAAQAEDSRQQAERDRQFADEQAAIAGTQAAIATVAQGEALIQAANAETQAARATIAQGEAQEQLDQTLRIQSLLLADLSEEQFLERDYQVALLLALESLSNYPAIPANQDAINALHAILTFQVREVLYQLHGDDVEGAVWSADETRVLTWARDGTVRIVDASGDEDALIMRHTASVNGATWNGDESRVLSWSRDYTARIWDAATGERLFVLLHGDTVEGATWNANEDRALTWSADGSARIWDLAAGEDATPLVLNHAERVNGAVWNGDETRVLTWSDDHTVRVWDAISGEEQMLLFHENDVNGARWNEDESVILSWSDDGTIRLWDAETGESQRRLDHNGVVRGARWNGDETRVLSWSSDGNIYLWDFALTATTTYAYEAGVNGARWNSDETQIMGWSDDNTVKIWDLTGEDSTIELEHDGNVEGARWNGDGTRVLSWSRDGTARVWDFAVSTRTAQFILQHSDSLTDSGDAPDPVNGARWNADELQVLTWSDDGTMRIWTLSSALEPVRLTDNEAFDFAPAWSPDGERIAFYSDRDGNREIYVMDADGSNSINLSNNSAQDENPAWSPDGNRIAFYSARDGNDEIYIMDADGSNPVRLTDDSALDYIPAWSPDGMRIAFTSNRDGNYEIYVMDADGSNTVRLTDNSADDFYPAWSPDGNRIAFASNRDGNEEIYVMDADGSNTVRLTNNSANDFSPAWSPDGSRITFASDRDGNTEIYVMDADGSNLVRQTTNLADDLSPAWSPDRTRIVYESDGELWIQSVRDVPQLIDTGQVQVIREMNNDERDEFFLQRQEPTASPTATPTLTVTPTVDPAQMMLTPTSTPLPSLTPSLTIPATPTITPTVIPANEGEACLGSNPGEFAVGGGDAWTYAGQEGETLTIRVDTGGIFSPDTRVILRAPDGTLLREDDDGGPSTDSLIEGFILPESGIYEIEVRGWQDETGGAYTLILESIRPGTM